MLAVRRRPECGFGNLTVWNATSSTLDLDKPELQAFLEEQWRDPAVWDAVERILNYTSIAILGVIALTEIWILAARGFQGYFFSQFPLFSERGLASNLFDVALVGLPLWVSR
jgi:hypothetical protein